MRKYLDVIWDDIKATFTGWAWREVLLILSIAAIVGIVISVSMIVVSLPWYCLYRYGLGYADDKSRDMAFGWTIITWVVLIYGVTVFDRAKR